MFQCLLRVACAGVTVQISNAASHTGQHAQVQVQIIDWPARQRLCLSLSSCIPFARLRTWQQTHNHPVPSTPARRRHFIPEIHHSLAFTHLNGPKCFTGCTSYQSRFVNTSRAIKQSLSLSCFHNSRISHSACYLSRHFVHSPP